MSFKYHASCLHTHPVVDALLAAMRENSFSAADISSIEAHVYSAAYERLKDVEPTSPWTAKFSIPFCLAKAAHSESLGLDAFTDEALSDPLVRALMKKVHVSVDQDLDRSYPENWISWVEVRTASGVVNVACPEVPKGDPGNPLTLEELKDKF
ncbi:MAG: MmgE/PrpD family protein, partial [bacterium]